MDPPIINCAENNWPELLGSLIEQGVEVDLINFDYDLHWNVCQSLARKTFLKFELGRDPAKKEARFRSRLKG